MALCDKLGIHECNMDVIEYFVTAFDLEAYKCLFCGRKNAPRASSLVQVSIFSGLSGSSNVIRCIGKLNSS